MTLSAQSLFNQIRGIHYVIPFYGSLIYKHKDEPLKST